MIYQNYDKKSLYIKIRNLKISRLKIKDSSNKKYNDSNELLIKLLTTHMNIKWQLIVLCAIII